MIAAHSALDVPQALLNALFRQPEALKQALDDAGLAPHEIAMWARQSGLSPDIEKQAGWLSVGRQPGHYKPLLEVAGSTLRAGEAAEALPLFRWAYRMWCSGHNLDPAYHKDGVKLLAQWGECLHLLQETEKARQCWLRALYLVQDEPTLIRLARVVERCDAQEAYRDVLEHAAWRDLPGAASLWQRWQRLQSTRPGLPAEPDFTPPPPGAAGVVVLADAANLDMVCRDQHGYHSRLDYARLLKAAAQHGPVKVKMAFVPDIPDTLPAREHLEQAGFTLDLLRPKRSHGRIAANADTAMAAFAVRWAGDPDVGRLELWSGDGDFVRVREVVRQVWPQVDVVFRSFETGTAAAIRNLGEDWLPIPPYCLRQ